MVRKLIACLTALHIALPAAGEEDAVERYRDYLPDQITQLSEEERRGVPMMYLGAANTGTSPAADIISQSNLAVLMYPALSDLDAAKMAFQSDLGEKPTGELTVWQLHQLAYRAARTNLTRVSFFPFDFGGWMFEDWAKVQGTVTILEEDIAYPINHARIDCDRRAGTCGYRQVALVLPDEASFAQIYNVMEIADETYRITRWEGEQIDAVPVSNTACRTNQLSLNFATEEFYEIARNNTEGDCELPLGITLPKLERPRVSQIVDGRTIVNAEFDEIGDEAFGYLSSEFRKRIEIMAEEIRREATQEE